MTSPKIHETRHAANPLATAIRLTARRSWLWMAAAILAAGVLPAQAHVWNMTRVRVNFTDASRCEVHLAIDLTRLLGTPDRYYELIQADPSDQSRRLQEVFEKIWPRFHFRVDETPLSGQMKGFRLPTGPRSEFGYVGVGKMTEFEVSVTLPNVPGSLWFEPEPDLLIEYPLAATYEITAQDFNVTRWLDVPSPSRRFDFRLHFAHDVALQSASVESKLDLSTSEKNVVSVLLTAWRYLHLGFRHIFPTGADHILFVIGLFFLGISWRKLLTQTTVFTIAHTTTLGLSACGIFSLPAWFVEPAIAGSIAFVAIENIVRPKLTSSRLMVVFMFGLIHGLGFAGSLSEVGLPKQEFWTALLSFNFGVDFGQLFILAVCFLTVGWFRDREWFRPRIVIPVCATVALIGLIWSTQRVVHYVSAI